MKNELYKKTYWDIIKKIKRLQFTYSSLLSAELYKRNIKNLSIEGAYIVYNLAGQKLNINELNHKNYFVGTNPCYALNKLEENGYLVRIPSNEDKREVYIQLTTQGLLTHHIIDQIIEAQSNFLEEIAIEKDDLSIFYRLLSQTENYWNSYLNERI